MTPQQRRRLIERRHRLAGDADSVDAAVRAVVALHATDPATVYLSVLARSVTSTLSDVAAAMYERRSLVRWLAMRRTLFVVPIEDVPVFQAAAGLAVAGALRTRLITRLERNGTDPPIRGDVARWVDSTTREVETSVAQREDATGAELGADVPRLRTTILARTPSERPQNLTTSLLTLLGAQGRVVRSTPVGPWTSRQHRWQHVENWWPDGLPEIALADAERELARSWLTRFGPATIDDLQWWTGWNKTTTARAVATLPVEDVDLHGRPGIALDPDLDPDLEPDRRDHEEPMSVLLPALDPTAMGWRHRDWYLAVDRNAIFDRAGNIGPTVWWDGEIVGSWAVTAGGEIRTACPVDRGRHAADSIAAAAARLQDRLGGAVVVPSARTPLERSLAAG